jgi:hypothetical protein
MPEVGAADLPLGPPGQVSNTSSSAPASNSAWQLGVSSQWWPQEENFALQPDAQGTQGAYVAESGWQSALSQPEGYLHFAALDQTLPPRTRPPVPPQIRVTTDLPPSGFPPGGPQTPQDAAAYYSASSNSSMPLAEDNTVTYSRPYSANLSPQDTRSYMPQENNMNTPVSPVSVHSPRQVSTGEPLSRKRSHSQMRDDAPPQHSTHHSRDGSTTSGLQNETSPAAEDFSPRGSRTFKRGEPPQNNDGKYYCNYAKECAGQIFDRKCEWR